MDAVNHVYRLAARPVGLPKPSDWTYTEEPVPEPGDGEVLVKVEYVSLDPAMRGWMNEGRSYIPPVGIGEVMRAFAVGEVIASNDPDVRGRLARGRAAGRAGVLGGRTAKACSRWTRAWRRCRCTWARWACRA